MTEDKDLLVAAESAASESVVLLNALTVLMKHGQHLLADVQSAQQSNADASQLEERLMRSIRTYRLTADLSELMLEYLGQAESQVTTSLRRTLQAQPDRTSPLDIAMTVEQRLATLAVGRQALTRLGQSLLADIKSLLAIVVNVRLDDAASGELQELLRRLSQPQSGT